jgi:hypothetical protein
MERKRFKIGTTVVAGALALITAWLVVWLALPSLATATPSAPLPLDQWRRHVIDDSKPWRSVFITAADMNGDNLPDIVTGGWWYRQPATPEGAWVRSTIGAPLNNMAAVHDFDGDGDVDVLGTSHIDDWTNFVAGEVPFTWARNDGDGQFVILDNITAGYGNFLQGVSVQQFQAGGPLQVALSWQNDAPAVGVQMLTVPADVSTEMWTWQQIAAVSQGEALSAGDIDGDGDLDLLLGTKWLQNNGATWSDHTLHQTTQPVDRNRLADINGDGRLDAVVGYQAANRLGKLAWYEQGATATDLWTEHIIANIIGPMSLDVADMDGDGDLDVVVGEHNMAAPQTASLYIYENTDGVGGAWTQHIVHTGDEHHDGAQVVDIDNDGDLDIISIGWSHNKVLLYENLAIDGGTTPTPTTPTPTATVAPSPTPTAPPVDIHPLGVQWRQLSTTKDDLPTASGSLQQTAALVVDVDNDGDLDFVIGSRGEPGPAVTWYRRDPTGWTQYIIEAAPLDIEAGGAWYDIDGDGDLDLVLGGDFRGNQLWWWENPYPDYHVDAPWNRFLIKDSGHNIHHDQIFGDFDGDGVDELVFWNQASWDPTNSDARLYIAEIPADPKATQPWSYTPILSAFGEGLAKADIDRDGKLDIIIGGFWLKHIGGTEYEAHPIDSTQKAARVAAGDLNEDGFIDLVMVVGDGTGPLRWYECTADPTDLSCWVAHDLLPFDVDHGHTLEIGDINRDGHLDIFVAEMRLDSGNSDAKMWHFAGDGAGNFTTLEIATGIGNHESRLADLDGDGDLDILGKPYNWQTPRLDIWLNEGTNIFGRWGRQTVDSARPWRAIFITTGDINGDGFEDIITGGWWYQNPGAEGDAWVRHTIGAPLNNMAAVYDFDGDGDLDILGTQGEGSSASNAFAWARNDGSGQFTVFTNIQSAQGNFLQGVAVARFQGPLEVALSWNNGTGGLQMLTVPASPATETWTWRQVTPLSLGEGLDVGDIDNDGDIDLILGTQWLRNDGTSWTPFVLHEPDTGESDRVQLVDMDQDGDLDAVIGYGHDPNGKLAWYEQGESATTLWTEHLIANLVNPQSIDVVDMDGDGDLDVVVGEHNLDRPGDSQLLVFLNLDGRGREWYAHTVHRGDEHHDGAQTADLDKDGDLDIVSIGWTHARVLVYENNLRQSAAADEFTHWLPMVYESAP